MHAVKGMATDWAKDELAGTIAANKYISDVLHRAKKGDDNHLFKKWPWGSLIVRGGDSGTSYAKISASLLLIDDIDRFKMNIGGTTSGKHKDRKIGEGSPLELLFDRVSGRFGNYKIFVNSSPRAEGESIIWPAYESADQNHFYVKCPRCGHYQTWEFENLKFKHKDFTLTEEPYILCQNTDCQKVATGPGFKAKEKPRVYEDDKYRVMQNWEYRPHSESIDPLSKSYRVSSLYSMLGYPFSQYATDWLSADKAFKELGDEAKKIRHRNTKQAMPWKRKAGKKIQHSALFKTMENLDPLPEDCVILSCGFDVQENPGRIEGQVNGYGPNNDRFLIDHRIFGGDPKIKPGLEGSPWNDVADFLLTKRYRNSWGQDQPIYCAAIDIGWGKEEAWIKYFIQNFEPLNLGNMYQPIFGVFGKEITKGSINFMSRTATQDVDGFETWGMYSNIKRVAIRNLLEKHIENKQAGNESNLHIGNKPCFTEDFFRQLTIRQPDEKGIMVKPYDHARDEPESCMFIADAAFILSFKDYEFGIDWDDFKKWNSEGINDGTSGKKAKRVISRGIQV